MTENEWTTSCEPEQLLKHAELIQAGTRKFWLFFCAGARHSDWMNREHYPEVVSACEMMADGLDARDQLQKAIDSYNRIAWPPQSDDAVRMYQENPSNPPWPMFFERPTSLAQITSNALLMLAGDNRGDAGWADAVSAERAWQCHLIRELFGNPFARVAIDRTRESSTTKRIAEAVYADHAFDRLPILADALEDAGCTDTEILEHCRGPGPHVRGCWVVDLLLDKK